MSTQRMVILLQALACAGAGTGAIERALMRISGVDVYVNPVTQGAHIDYDPARTTPADLGHALEAEGFGSGAPGLT